MKFFSELFSTTRLRRPNGCPTISLLRPTPGAAKLSAQNPPWNAVPAVLPDDLARSVHRTSRYTFIIIFLLFMNDTFVSRGFWQWIILVSNALKLNFGLVSSGLRMFRFWTGR